MKKVLILYRGKSNSAQRQERQLAQWLAENGRQSFSLDVDPESGAEPSPGDLPQQADLAVVLGGDGTMLGAVRLLAGAGFSGLPVLGVNLGGLGFLTELAPEELYPALGRVLEGSFEVTPRLMLSASVSRGGQTIERMTALNDVVIGKEARAGMVELKTAVDGRHLNNFRADGLIVATPTGSTAYNLSAGGPICHPGIACVLVTPICSFALSNRPLLISPQSALSVTLGPGGERTSLTFDGQVGLNLAAGDVVSVAVSRQTVSIIHSPFKDYFEILRTKLHWG